MIQSETLFPLFYSNPFIQSIAEKCKWTISDQNKIPIDMRALVNERRIIGAVNPDERCLMTLKEVCDTVPDAANHAFYLDALVDNFVVVDIEPEASNEVRQKFLAMPYLYGEVSLSGKGLHLIFPLPECIHKYPNAMQKIVFKDSAAHYEILLCHYVTFTRKMIHPSTADPNEDSFVKAFQEMASEQKEVVRRNIDISSYEDMDIPNKEDIINILCGQQYKKTVKDFDNDNSKYEFGYASFLYYKLSTLLKVTYIKDGIESKNYDQQTLDNVKAFLMYKVLESNLPHRAKHEENRDNLPWLLYISREIIAKTDLTKA